MRIGAIVALVILVGVAVGCLVHWRGTHAADPALERAIVAGDWQRAADLAQAWQKRDPTNPVPVCVAAAAVGFTHKADEAYRIWMPRAEEACEAARGDRELVAWAKALTRRHPRSAQAYQVAAAVLGLDHRYSEALDPANQAVRLAPGDPLSLATRGAAYLGLSRLGEATSDLEGAVKLDPKAAASYSDLAAAQLGRGHLEQAVSAADRAVAVSPELSSAYSLRGWAKCLSGDYTGGLDDLTRGVDLAPQNPEAYLKRATAYERISQYRLALKDADQALVLDSRNVKALILQPWIYSLLGNGQGALADCRRVADLIPTPRGAYDLLTEEPLT